MELQIGDIIQDNDKRMGKRQLRIVSIDGKYVRACHRGDTADFPRTVRIRHDRINDHFRSSGFTRIDHAALRGEGE